MITLVQTVDLQSQRQTCYIVMDLYAWKRYISLPIPFKEMLITLHPQFHLLCQGLLEKLSGGCFCNNYWFESIS
jgi:hypothetical protein